MVPRSIPHPRSLLACLFAFVLAFGASKTLAGENLLDNPGFENGMDGWSGFVPKDSEQKGCEVAVINTGAHSGGACLEMKSTDFARYSVGPKRLLGDLLQPGDRCRLTFWIRAGTGLISKNKNSPDFIVRMLLLDDKGQNLADARAIFLGLNGKSAEQSLQGNVDLSGLGGEIPSQWTKVEAVFEVPRHLNAARLGMPAFFAQYTQGSILLDDFSMEKVGNDVPATTTTPKPHAALSLPDIFSDHAVLQSSPQTALWGMAAPGETVSIALGASAAQATADGQGKWRVSLDLSKTPPGPFDLVVKGGDDTLAVHDVMVGDVWIASGQSNMEFKLSQTIGGPEEIARSADPTLRCFLPKRQALPTPAPDLPGHWIVAGPRASGEFSGVAYYFAKTLQAARPGVYGLVDTSWGGTYAEAWMSSAGLDHDPDLKKRKDEVVAAKPQADARLRQFPEEFRRWADKYHREDTAAQNPAVYADPQVSTADWKTVTLPGSLASQGLPDSGVVWLRREVEIPARNVSDYMPLFLGTLHDFETIYWDGKKIGETTPVTTTSWNADLAPTTDRRYDLRRNMVKPGPSTLAIRLYSPGGNAGLQASRFVAAWNVWLNGPWKAKVESELPPLPADAKASYPHRPPWPPSASNTATYLYNGMVHPLEHLALRGVIWYQGEGNSDRAYQYRTTFPLLIQDWREHFGQTDLPFYFCQLANFMAKPSVPGDSAWAELRDAQTHALALPHTGMAVLIDQGEELDIHFRDKKAAGERLAAIALAKTYGQTVPCSGPVYRSAEARDGKIRLHFDAAEGGLTAHPLPATYQPKSSMSVTKPLVLPSPGSELQGFATCGEDGKWKWADARVDGDSVVVSSPEVPAPKFVRYAWADNPTCNLYNKAGFPAVPFRTDDFPETTLKNKF